MAQDTILTSLHGRKLGLSSSGGILANETNSTGPLVAVMKSTAQIVQGMITDLAAVVATTIANYGHSVLSSATATAATYILAAPVAGAYKEISIAASASEITVQGTATTILFGSTGADKLFFSAAKLSDVGNSVILRGISSTRWAILAKPTSLTATGG